MEYVGKTRFKVGGDAGYAEYKTAAADYPDNLTEFERRGLKEKPLDWRQGHPSYFFLMQQLLSALKAINLPVRSKFIEVGAGAGWTTEILASLCYNVTAIEPASTMIDVARVRVRQHLEHHGVGELIDNVQWICSTMEECALPDGEADAVLYFESFHHVVDEHIAVAKTFAALKPGGLLVILGDSNWIPGNAEQETAWAEETEKLGTLESPFTDAYLSWLLEQNGFRDVTRHHLVDALIPTTRETEPVVNFAAMHAVGVNLVIARKPGGTEAAVASVATPVAHESPVRIVEPPVTSAEPLGAHVPSGRIRAALARRLRLLASRIESSRA